MVCLFSALRKNIGKKFTEKFWLQYSIQNWTFVLVSNSETGFWSQIKDKETGPL